MKIFDHVGADVQQTDTNARLAIRQIAFARQYSLALLDSIPEDRWCEMPAGAETHVAWQAAHLAVAEYALCMFRQRGPEPEDRDILPGDWLKRFGKDSKPDPDPAANPTAEEIRRVLHAVHQQAMQELEAYPAEHFEQSVPEPFAVYDTKLGALLFCAQHEMVHAGQIGLLRRLLGLDPLR
ncbi:DinB family protein [Thermostilla marina]